MKALIVYCSLTRKTELVAKAIAQILNADIRKIEEVEKEGSLLFFYLEDMKQ